MILHTFLPEPHVISPLWDSSQDKRSIYGKWDTSFFIALKSKSDPVSLRSSRSVCIFHERKVPLGTKRLKFIPLNRWILNLLENNYSTFPFLDVYGFWLLKKGFYSDEEHYCPSETFNGCAQVTLLIAVLCTVFLCYTCTALHKYNFWDKAWFWKDIFVCNNLIW